MFKGKVVWFDSQRGFGFVRKDSDGTEYFAHFSQIQMSAFSVPGLQAGPATTLRVSRGRKKKA